jgi:hypothetical protein
MDITQAQTKKILEALVGKRFNKEALEAHLTEKFSYPVTVDDISREDDELPDYNLITNIDIKYPDGFHLFADIDIYFLKMRREGFDAADMYITEVSVEFE